MSQLRWFIEPVDQATWQVFSTDMWRGYTSKRATDIGERRTIGPMPEAELLQIRREIPNGHILAYRQTGEDLPSLNPYWSHVPNGKPLKDFIQ